MRSPPASHLPPVRRASAIKALACGVVAGLASLLVPPAWAEKSDRNQPVVIEADRSGSVELQRQVLTVWEGNAVFTQGSMLMRAERIEARQTPEGYYAGLAQGSPGKQASWRQRREGLDEVVEGTADRIEFDGRTDTLRLVGNSAVRRLRAGVVAEEISGANIVWDNLAEVFRAEGGAQTALNPSGRVRAVLAPRSDVAGPAPAPAVPAAPTLTPSRSLGTESRDKPKVDAKAPAKGASAAAPKDKR